MGARNRTAPQPGCRRAARRARLTCMGTRAVHIVVDAADPSRLAAFWAAALGWEVAADEPNEVVVDPPGFDYPNPEALPLVFVPVRDRKTAKNRIHLDLATTS